MVGPGHFRRRDVFRMRGTARNPEEYDRRRLWLAAGEYRIGKTTIQKRLQQILENVHDEERVFRDFR